MSEQEVQADPVVKVARDLSEIVELHTRLLTQAVRLANHGLMPGGPAMVALGNVANLESWEYQQETTERLLEHANPRLRRAYTSAEDEDPEESWSAFQLLEFWSEQWRREHGAEYDQRPTIVSEANFLRYLLNWAWDNEPAWDDFAKDVRQARLRLENILTAGRRSERTRVKCNNPDCPNPRNLLRLVGVDGREDTWKCTGCKQRFNTDAFKRAEARQIQSDKGNERYIPVQEAVALLKDQGRQERTIRRWLEPPVRHTADKCTECKRKWPPQEHPACPGIVDGEECGGELQQVKKGDANAIVGGFCEIGTRKSYVWWPDLWRRHMQRKAQDAMKSASMTTPVSAALARLEA